MSPDDEAAVAAAIDDARRAGVPEAEVDRLVRRTLARGESPFAVFIIEGKLASMARDARRER